MAKNYPTCGQTPGPGELNRSPEGDEDVKRTGGVVKNLAGGSTRTCLASCVCVSERPQVVGTAVFPVLPIVALLPSERSSDGRQP